MLLRNIEKRETEFTIFLGFDGFVDKILKLIKYKSRHNLIPFQSMGEFSEYIGEKSGKSCSIEMEIIQEKIGGNMPIAANALGNLGCKTLCVGAFGYPEINPMFRNMSENCELHSISEPGYCSALEFEDGKIMLATNTHLDDMDYQRLIERVSEQELIRCFEESDAAAFLNWGELIQSNDIWANLLQHIIPKCRFAKKKKMLIDFSDFSKREKEEVEQMLRLLQLYATYFEVVVSLNENELHLFLEKLELGQEGESLESKILALSKHFVCEHFVIHLLECSKYVRDQEVYTIEKEVIREPKIITGGGDNFNAGLLFGLLCEVGIEEAIKVGSALSCLYVREGEKISFEELNNYSFYETKREREGE